MAASIIGLEVEDYDRWRSMFDSMAELRRERGIRAGRVYQDVSNPNSLTIMIEGDLADLRAYGESQDLKEAMANAGVIGPPRMALVNDVT